VRRGRAAIGAALQAADARLIVVDVIDDADLIEIGAAAAGQPLITGGSGIALGLPDLFRARGALADAAVAWAGVAGPAAVLSGSCSLATLGQVARHRGAGPALELTPEGVMSGAQTAETAARFILSRPDELPLVYSSADAASVRAAQDRHGREALAARMEATMADIARRVVAGGVTRLVIAGGETSGAVVAGLDAGALEIGPEIDPGVPAVKVAGRPLALALKSGNFGGPDFFARAAARLGAP
jgi:uncharacterized protein YgbK (DUF1537 family)